jgi:Mg2+/citrate symporter
MEDFIIWIIIIALVIIIGNQTRERQARETKDMTKKQKEKYFNDINKKQKEDGKKVLWWIGGIFVASMLLLFLLIS